MAKSPCTPKASYKRRPAGSLKHATDQLIAACGGSTSLAAMDGMRVSKQTLFNYSDGDGDEARQKFMPIDVVLYCERVAGDPVLTRYLAAEQGYALLRVPSDAALADLPPKVAAAAAEASDVFATMAAVLADGTVTAAEAGAAIDEIDEALTAFVTLRGELAGVRDSTNTSASRDGARERGPDLRSGPCGGEGSLDGADGAETDAPFPLRTVRGAS